MQKILTKVIFLSAIIFLTSCAAQKVSNGELQVANKIAILSELDTHMNKVLVGSSMFESETSQYDVTSWHVNRSIENDLAQKLWTKGKEVVILQANTMEIMHENKKIVTNQSNYKGATLVIIVKPIDQIDNYPLFPEGYGLFEKQSFGMTQRLIYASIIYEVYSTKDGARKGYYLVHPDGANIIKLDTKIPFKQLKEPHLMDYKSEFYTLLDQLDTNALINLGFE